MGRLVRISIYSLVILILYFWVTAILKSYQKSSEVATTETTNETDTIGIDSLLADTTYDQSILDEAPLTNQEIVDGKVNYDVVDKKLEALEEKKNAKPLPAKSTQKTTKTETPKPVNKNKATNNTKLQERSSVEPGDGGAYMVMAGSFLLKDNANARMKKLRSMGYANAEVVIFQASQYHSVVAARYSSEAKARATSDDLKRKGVDSFVKTN